ncbi:leucine-rich repeat extensin-like protein 1 [Lates japonicus]|uniref:Leucine-rich repeat extensin-like protein 1 n=1 Tax=Lates japonicus TaxID=270547 RepID=A0AAD3N678_LATJO|nr:leucine-rich repeat extensin-like protein 1 [Lates japonicus]
MYEAGELSHYEENYEMGDYLRETEDQGYMPPPLPPMPMSAEPSFTSPPRPGPGVGGGWGGYPYFDYRLLYGDYPPGTYTHSSSNFEQGADHWYDDHYIRYDPYDPAPEPQTFAAPQHSEAPKTPVKAAGLGSSPGSFRQPTRPRRYNPGKVC